MSTLTVGAAGIGGEFDYTCDGAADEVQILAALEEAGPGGAALLSDGTFHPAGQPQIPAGRTLAGAGATILDFGTAAYHAIVALGGNTIRDIELRGSVALAAKGSDVTCLRLTSRQALRGAFAFGTWSTDTTVERVRFEDCHAIDTSGFGFFMGGDGTDAGARDISFDRCTAIRCGLAHDNTNTTTREWVTGFHFGEYNALALERITATDCHAERAYESGFHADMPRSLGPGCVLTRCTATDCGVDKPSPVIGCGFTIEPEFVLTDCTATGCYVGIKINNTLTPRHMGPAVLTRCRVVRPVTDAFFAYSQDAFEMADCVAEGVAAPHHALWLKDVIGAQITDLRLTDCTGDVYEDGTSAGTTITYYVAPFRASVAAPVTGEAVAFTDASDNDGLTAWGWDFGDGSGSAAQHPTHAYPTAGVYPVTLAAGGNVVSQTITVLPGVSYGGARLSHADLAPLDHDPVANATDLQNGRVGLQGSPVSRRAWTINGLADDRAEIEALAALKGQHLTLNLNGTEYPGVMIRPPFLETQLTPAAWAYQVGFVQETRR